MKILFAAFFVALVLPVSAAKKQVGYYKPVRLRAKVIHCNVETPGLRRHTITGNRLSTRLCASNALPLGSKVFIAYRVKKGRRLVKMTRYWIVADRPKSKTMRPILVEPYIRKAHEQSFLSTFEGVRQVTVLKPRYF